MNILIIRLSSLGDVVLATSVVEYLKSSFPQSSIWFATEQEYAGLFTADPRVTRVVALERGKEGKAVSELSGVAWDNIVDLQNNGRSVRIRRHIPAKAPVSVFKKRRLERAVLLLGRVNLYPQGDSVIARYARAAGYSGHDPRDFPPARLCLDERTCEQAMRFFPSSAVVRPAVALFPFSAWKNKEWPIAKFAFVGRYFAIKGWDVFIAGGPQDTRAGESLRRSIGERCVSVAGKLSLYETACLLQRCRLALGNDTGLSHMARACGVKTGVIYGPTTSHFGFYPSGNPPFRVFEASQFCRPCHAHGGNICLTGSRNCLKKIPPEAVIAGLENLYHQNDEAETDL
jgi:heptosyltransferase-2